MRHMTYFCEYHAIKTKRCSGLYQCCLRHATDTISLRSSHHILVPRTVPMGMRTMSAACYGQRNKCRPIHLTTYASLHTNITQANKSLSKITPNDRAAHRSQPDPFSTLKFRQRIKSQIQPYAKTIPRKSLISKTTFVPLKFGDRTNNPLFKQYTESSRLRPYMYCHLKMLCFT